MTAISACCPPPTVSAWWWSRPAASGCSRSQTRDGAKSGAPEVCVATPVEPLSTGTVRGVGAATPEKTQVIPVKSLDKELGLLVH